MKRHGKVGLIRMLLRKKLFLMDIMIHLIPFASFYLSGEHLQKVETYMAESSHLSVYQYAIFIIPLINFWVK